MAKSTKEASAARKHSLPTTLGGYENLLIKMICKRTCSEFDEFLLPQVCTCAQTWMMLNKVHKALMDEKNLVDLATGSKKQQVEKVNPLLAYYLKLQAELRLQFEALGLNYRVTPSKITDTTKKGVDENDPLVEFFKNAKQ